jgi:tetraacyldisaccharide 4'-kinase
VLRSCTEAAGNTAWLRGRRVIAWAGIASPQRFFSLLQALGAQLAECITFRDHQSLTEADAERLLGLGQRLGAPLVSTEKDLVRLKGATGKRVELAAATQTLPIRLHFAEAEAERLAALIENALKGRSGP